MFSIFRKKAPLLTVSIDGKEVCSIATSELPVEKNVAVEIKEAGKEIVFQDGEGKRAIRHLLNETGWFGFSIRVHENKACQVDCVFGPDDKISPERFSRGEISGIRFQPFFLGEAGKMEQEVKGHGLFHRGLHFSGMVTPGNVSLSCVCDSCGKSFRLQSFHAGFSQSGYMYSDSGIYTIIIPDDIPGAPPAMGRADSEAVKRLEERLPKAPDGSSFRYLNPLRCPHCRAAYIDFGKFPQDREQEYYGNTVFGVPPVSYRPLT
ncbi:MAG: hypothetical protein ACO1QS_21015 [Verrucomicrobiota bacterium]